MNMIYVENIEVVIMKIMGLVWFMGMYKFFYNEMDLFKEGFLLILLMEYEMEDIK